jgi:hypothetical protein
MTPGNYLADSDEAATDNTASTTDSTSVDDGFGDIFGESNDSDIFGSAGNFHGQYHLSPELTPVNRSIRG